MRRLSFIVAFSCLVAAAGVARAVVEAEMPLAQLARDSQLIAVTTLVQVDREGGKRALKIERVLKGDAVLESVPIKLVAPPGGEGDPSDMLQRVEDGTKLVLFLSQLSPTEHQAFAYTSGSWFKLRGVGELSQLKAVFLQGEPYLRRTYRGDETELAQLLHDFLANKGKLPEIDKSAEPGLGPVLQHGPPSQTVAAAPDQIEIGPAWSSEETAAKDDSGSTTSKYLSGALLVIAVVGLAFMLLRSAPEGAA